MRWVEPRAKRARESQNPTPAPWQLGPGTNPQRHNAPNPSRAPPGAAGGQADPTAKGGARMHPLLVEALLHQRQDPAHWHGAPDAVGGVLKNLAPTPTPARHGHQQPVMATIEAHQPKHSENAVVPSRPLAGSDVFFRSATPSVGGCHEPAHMGQ